LLLATRRKARHLLGEGRVELDRPVMLRVVESEEFTSREAFIRSEASWRVVLSRFPPINRVGTGTPDSDAVASKRNVARAALAQTAGESLSE
jgi:hypothetical protein